MSAARARGLAISKSGINALMRHVAMRLGQDGIRSNAIAPGLVMTEGSIQNMPKSGRTI